MAKGQKKWKKTDETILKVVKCLQNWLDRNSACVNSGISRASFHLWINDDPDFKTLVEDAEEFWMWIVESKKKEKIDEWYRPAIEKELKSKRREVYGDKLDTTEKIVQTTIDYKELKDKTPAELDELRRTLLG